MAGIGDHWGTREEMLHPRDAHGRFRRTWRMPDNIIEKITGFLARFRPRMFGSDAHAGQYAFNHARPGRFARRPGRGPTTARLLPGLDARTDTIDGFHEAQAALRAGRMDEQTREFVAHYDRLRSPTEDDLIVSRRVTPEAFGLTAQTMHGAPGTGEGGIEDLTGKEIHDAGYFPANLGTPVGQSPVLMTVAVPKGTQAVFPGNGSTDREIILDRGQHLRVTKVTPDGRGGYYVAAVVAPHAEGETPRTVQTEAPPAPGVPRSTAVPEVLQQRTAPEQVRSPMPVPGAVRPGQQPVPRAERVVSPAVGSGTPSGALPAQVPEVPEAAKPQARESLSSDPVVREVEVDNRVRTAYRAVRERRGGGNEWVGLADLRDEIGDTLTRDELDAALVRLGSGDYAGPGKPHLVPIQNLKSRTARDKAAALRLGGEEQDAISFQDPSPRPVPKPKTRPETEIPEAERAAHARYAKIDHARSRAELVIELDELYASNASTRALEHRLSAKARAGGIPESEIEPILQAVRSGDEAKARQLAVGLGRREGVELVGHAGQRTRFNRDQHEPISRSTIPDSAEVVVVRSGWTYTPPDGERITVRPVVQEAGVPEAGVPEGRRLPEDVVRRLNDPKTTVAQLRQVAKEHGVKVPSSVTRKADIRDHILGKPGVPAPLAKMAKKLPEVTPSRKLGPDAVDQLNDPKVTVAKMREIAREHGIKIPSSVTRKADIKEYLLKRSGPGSEGGLSSKVDTPEQRDAFKAAWVDAKISAPQGSSRRELNEVYLDVRSGKITPAEGIRRLDSGVEIDQHELADMERTLKRPNLTPDERKGLEKRVKEQHQFIEAKTKASKLLREHFNAGAGHPMEAGPSTPGIARAAPLQVRDSLAKATDTDSLARITQNELKRVTGRDIVVDLGPDADLTTSQEHMEGILRMVEQWPDADLREVRWFSGGIGEVVPGSGKRWPWAVGGNHAIMFNSAYSSPAGRTRYLEELAAGTAGWATSGGSGFHPRDADIPAIVAIHEFGHILDQEGRIHLRTHGLVRRRAEAAGVHPSVLVRRQVSEYASRGDLSELVAEAFLDVSINGDDAGALSKQIVALLRAEYERTRGGRS